MTIRGARPEAGKIRKPGGAVNPWMGGEWIFPLIIQRRPCLYCPMFRLSCPDDVAAPFEVIDGAQESGLLLVCDHASPVIPEAYGDLGLAPEDRMSHVVWDIGAAQVTRILARRLGCPAVLAGVSRLVIDCNRDPEETSSIPADSCGVRVPGNARLSPAQAQERAQRWFHPYHRAIVASLARLTAKPSVPAVIAIHSFTPCLGRGAPVRPWDVGVLWNRDDRMAAPVLRRLRARGDMVVGANQPYSAQEINYTLDTHAGAVGLPHVSFEIRQDLVGDVAGCVRWADILEDALVAVLADPAHRHIRRF